MRADISVAIAGIFWSVIESLRIFWSVIESLRMQMAPKGRGFWRQRLLRDSLRQKSFRGGRVCDMEVNFGAVWSGFRGM